MENCQGMGLGQILFPQGRRQLGREDPSPQGMDAGEGPCHWGWPQTGRESPFPSQGSPISSGKPLLREGISLTGKTLLLREQTLSKSLLLKGSVSLAKEMRPSPQGSPFSRKIPLLKAQFPASSLSSEKSLLLRKDPSPHRTSPGQVPSPQGHCQPGRGDSSPQGSPLSPEGSPLSSDTAPRQPLSP